MKVEFEATGGVAQAFDRCRMQQRAAFIPFLMAGDPDGSTSIDIIEAAALGGADIIEIGIPYSDPLADGPTIQQAAQRALSGGMTFDAALDVARRARERLPGTPLIGFTYYNPVLARGVVKSARDFAAAGLSGIIVADLPPMESAPLVEAFRKQGLGVTLLVAPTTPDERAAAIAALCTDFVYVVSRMGVTGTQWRPGEMVRDQLQRLRALTDKPLACGFGIASGAQVAELAFLADGVIVGSALIDRIAAARTPGAAVEDVHRFCSELSLRCRREQVSD